LLEPRLTAALTWPRAQRPRPRRLIAPGFLNSAFHRAETAVSPIRGVPQQALPARLYRLLRESQILRVDHFLGKEPVVELE
jgi:Glucose-6-phosphate dehydrogenase, NAD binding domain